MINVVDIVRKGDEHRTIILPTFQSLIDNELINRAWLSQDSTTLEELNSLLKKRTTTIDVSSKWIYRWIISTLFTMYIVIRSKITNTDMLFLSASPLQTLVIMILSIYKSSRSRANVFMHGELSYLSQSRGVGRTIGRYLLNLCLRHGHKFNIQFIILTYPVYRKICEIFGEQTNIKYIEFPTYPSSFKILKNEKKKIRIGSFGVHSGEKNSHLIYNLAEILYKKQTNIEIVTIGTAYKDFQYDQHCAVTHILRGNVQKNLIPRDEFINEVKKLDIALTFYGNTMSSEFIPSGVFNECINYNIPIAGIRSGYLSYYFEKYGNIGILANDINQLAEKICRISDDVDIIFQFKVNLEEMSRDMNYINFSKNLKNIINDK